VDASGAIQYANPAATRLTGYEREELLGRNPRLLKSGLHDEDFYRRMWSTLLAGEVWNGDIVNRRKDGTLSVERTTIAPVRDAQGRIGHFIALKQDVTERRREEEALRRLQFAIEHAADGFLWADESGRIQYANAAVCRRLGYTREEMLALTISDFDPGFPRESWPQHWASVKAAGARVIEATHRAKDGTLFPVEVSVNHVEFEGSEYHCVFVRDISDRKRAEAAVREAEDRLRQSQRLEAIGRLAGGVAHDFNNLLGVIMGYGQSVAKKLPGGDPLAPKVDQILKAADRAATLTRQLLAFSRQQVLQPRVLDLNAVLGEMQGMLGQLIGEDVRLVTAFDPMLGQVKADAGQLEQIVMNLAVNARDAMPEGGTLTIETANRDVDAAYVAQHPPIKAGRYVMMAVSDTGHGMDAEVQAHMFEPFYTTKEKGKGTGLGLATVYGIVKQSEGYIWAYSEKDLGTTFKIYLPRVDDLPAEARETAAAVTGGSETLLLVEDEEALRDLLRETLESYGYEVIVAADGAEAIRAAAGHARPIHVLITDVVMPGASGRRVADEIAAARPDMKVLFMSGYTDEAIHHHGVFGPGAAFIGKPFSAQALARKLREILEGGA
jgi:PAS domain S-box-containing protein